MEGTDLDRLFREKLWKFKIDPSSEAREVMDQYFKTRQRKKVIHAIGIAAGISALVFLMSWAIYYQIQSDNLKQIEELTAAERIEPKIENEQIIPPRSQTQLLTINENEEGKDQNIIEVEDKAVVQAKVTVESKGAVKEMPDEIQVKLPVADGEGMINEAVVQEPDDVIVLKSDSALKLLAVNIPETEETEINQGEENNKRVSVTIIYKTSRKHQETDNKILASTDKKGMVSLKDVSDFAMSVREKSPTLGDLRATKDELLAFDFLKDKLNKTQNKEGDE